MFLSANENYQSAAYLSIQSKWGTYPKSTVALKELK